MMFQMHAFALIALAKMRQEDYLREAQQHRRTTTAERGYEPAMETAPRAVGWFRRGPARTQMSRVPAHSR